MAINKVVNHGSKSHSGMKNVIGYVLRDDKVREGYVRITGPYPDEEITAAGVYKSFLDEKRLWDKDSGRMYAHNVISFHRDEKITPAECLEIGEQFADRFFPRHQSLIGVHQDRDHIHQPAPDGADRHRLLPAVKQGDQTSLLFHKEASSGFREKGILSQFTQNQYNRNGSACPEILLRCTFPEFLLRPGAGRVSIFSYTGGPGGVLFPPFHFAPFMV